MSLQGDPGILCCSGADSSIAMVSFEAGAEVDTSNTLMQAHGVAHRTLETLHGYRQLATQHGASHFWEGHVKIVSDALMFSSKIGASKLLEVCKGVDEFIRIILKAEHATCAGSCKSTCNHDNSDNTFSSFSCTGKPASAKTALSLLEDAHESCSVLLPSSEEDQHDFESDADEAIQWQP